MTEKTNAFTLLFDNIKQNKTGLLRLWIVVAGIHLVSLMLGIAIFLIVFGAQIAMRRIFIHWAPARNWLSRVFELKTIEYDKSTVLPFYTVLVNIFHSVVTLLFVAFGFYAIKVGVDILLHDGFLGQNFLYLLFIR